MKSMKYALSLFAMLSLLIFTGCGDDDAPAAENEEEEINKAILTFTPEAGGTILTFTYEDPDGAGTDPAVQDKIILVDNTEYIMTVQLKNTVGGANDDITTEVAEEGDEHMIFYGWTDGLFALPSGDGNIDNRSAQTVAYGDFDGNGQPIGLITTWRTGDAASGTFKMMLKHQPNIKSATSTAQDGETDVELDWEIEIQ